jgi:hypothetical protein
MRFGRVITVLVPAMGAALLVGPSAQASPPVANGRLEVSVVSSAPDQVSGGDARLHVTVPPSMRPEDVAVLVNGDDQRESFGLLPGTRTLSGVVDGLALGTNTVEVRRDNPGRGRPPQQRVELTNFPITGPIFSGEHQYPFVCNTESQGLGQPIVDDPTSGTRVVDASGAVIGYSRDCTVQTRVDMRYLSASGGWQEPPSDGSIPDDATMITAADGTEVPLLVRWERGTINRFIYSLAVPVPWGSEADDPFDPEVWNGAAIYRFDGGVAIGHTQGRVSQSAMLYQDGLTEGYAILHSSGTRTSTHYNLQLGGETALMVKERFVELVDVPRYTVGIGGSGGAIQQYVYAQNHPGLIDAAIPQLSYPDMVTQAVHVGDCELLEHYMDRLSVNPLWATWSNRTLLEGMNASDTVSNPFTGKPGNTECINGWRGLSPLALNPNFGSAPNQESFEPQAAIASTEWSHFADIVNIVGRADDSYARNYWDNVGVQYGLESVASGAISPEEFLWVNGSIGGWKNEPDMVQEGFPFLPGAPPSDFDPWSARNQVFSKDPLTDPAPRQQGDLLAMQAVYESGLVFRGDIDIPVLDVRPYLESVLDMHNSHQSFASRQRMLNADGDASNQVIWFIDGPGNVDITPMALDVVDEWMANIAAKPNKKVAANAPAGAVDQCFEKTGTLIAAGPGVWDGILDDESDGACTQRFPLYSTSRQVAGGPIEQSYFKCALIDVQTAVERGIYGQWTPSPQQQTTLQRIFPDGVCDYAQPDQGLPSGWR